MSRTIRAKESFYRDFLKPLLFYCYLYFPFVYILFFRGYNRYTPVGSFHTLPRSPRRVLFRLVKGFLLSKTYKKFGLHTYVHTREGNRISFFIRIYYLPWTSNEKRDTNTIFDLSRKINWICLQAFSVVTLLVLFQSLC